MNSESNNNVYCSTCNSVAEDAFDFRPFCGSILRENIMCANHQSEQAEAVCIICCRPCCASCGAWVSDHYFCARHEHYEMYEGMVRVYGVSDEAMVQHARNCLEQAGLHPFVYLRKMSPLSPGGPDYTLFRASGEYDGPIINEVKLMVPCQEVSKAEDILHQLTILQP